MWTLVLTIGLNGPTKTTANLTAREFGEVLTTLSKKYILVFDTVTNITEAVGCTVYMTALDR